jgi:hypothetical protein
VRSHARYVGLSGAAERERERRPGYRCAILL